MSAVMRLQPRMRILLQYKRLTLKNKNKKNSAPINKNPTGVKTSSVKHKTEGAKAESIATAEEKREKLPLIKRLWFRITAIAVLLAIVIGGVATALYFILRKDFDYMTSDLSDYVIISEDDYKNYDITVSVKRPGALELEERIMQLLASKKSSKAENDGVAQTVGVITNGSVVSIRYRGYTVDSDGNEVEFDGGTNFTSSTGYSLAIGSGDFISGFEYGLLGKEISEYSSMTSVTSGKIKASDIALVSMYIGYTGGVTDQLTNVRIDLSDPAMREKYGDELIDKLIGSSIGVNLGNIAAETDSGSVVKDTVYCDVTVKSVIRPSIVSTEGAYKYGDIVKITYKETDGDDVRTVTRKLLLENGIIDTNFGPELREFFYPLVDSEGTVGYKSPKTVTDDDGVIYSDLEVIGVVKYEDKPITVEAYFPYDYEEASLAGKKVYFDVYVDNIIYYDTPVLDEKFITETAGLTEEELAGYEGTLIEKYRARVMETLEEEYEESVRYVAEQKMWEHLNASAEFVEIPEELVKSLYDKYYGEMASVYNEYYSMYYESVEVFAPYYFGYDTSIDTVESYLTEIAETEVKEKLIFYYIGREEELFPDEDELNELFDEKVELLLPSYLSQNDCKRENFEDDESYNAKVAELRHEMIHEYYTEALIREAILYEVAIPKMLDMANEIKNIYE